MSKYHNDICSSITLANRCYKTDMHASVDFALEQCMFDSLEIEACLRDAPLAAWEADGRVAIVNSIFRIYLICDVRADMIYIAHAAYF